MLLGEKKEASRVWFLGDPNQKYEEAADLYEKAANLYKIDGEWAKAGKAFTKSADCFLKIGNNYEASSSFVKAGKCFKKIDIERAIQCLILASEGYYSLGRFPMAAGVQKLIGELCGAIGEQEREVVAYTLAAEYYNLGDQTMSANEVYIRAAKAQAILGRYIEAATIYERVAGGSIMENKWNVKSHLFAAGLCRILHNPDSVAAENTIRRYEALDVTFGSTVECSLLKEISESLAVSDVGSFTEAVRDYSQRAPLGDWNTTLLIRIKDIIRNAPLNDVL